MKIHVPVWLAALSFIASIGGGARAQCLPDPVTEWFPNVGQGGDAFGFEVAISGDWAVVGAPLDDDLAVDAGAAYVYEKTASGWVLREKLYAPDGATLDHFGIDVDIDGEVIVVGARQHDHGAPSSANAGAAYVFDRNGSAWTCCVELQGSGTGANAAVFGSKVAISADTIVVGSNFDDASCNPGEQDCGAAYVYVEPTGGWCTAQTPLLETAKLVASDRSTGDQLGTDVGVDGPIVVASTGFDDHPNGTPDVGSVYVFERPIGGWTGGATTPTMETATIIPMAPVASGDGFGIRVAVDHDPVDPDRVAIGARGRATYGIGAGEAYVLDEPPGGWSGLIQAAPNVHSSQTTTGDDFGLGIDLDGDRVVVGAQADDPQGISGAGRAFVFELQGTTWVETHWLLDPNPGQDENLGVGIAVRGDTVLVGGHRDTNSSGNAAGAVHVFELAPCCLRLHCFCGAAPCGNDDPAAGCANGTGEGALLVGYGSTSVSSDDLVLEATGVTPSQFGIFFMGPADIPPLPYGNGERCVGGGSLGLFRYPVQFSGTQGILVLGPGIVALSRMRFTIDGHIDPGETWNFQAWYRDPNGACGTSFNFSNAIRVDFKP